MNKKTKISRKMLKIRGRAVLKRNLLAFIVLCFFLGMLKIEYSNSFTFLRGGAADVYLLTSKEGRKSMDTDKREAYDRLYQDIDTINSVGYAKGLLDVMADTIENSDKVEIKSKVLGRQRGILASVVNGVTKGTFASKITEGIGMMVNSESIAVILALALSVFFSVFVNFYIMKVLLVTFRRIFLEYRTYDKVPAKRFLYAFSVKKLLHTGWTMLVTSFFYALWSLTIIGAVVKRYSYAMVPYIMAENPNIKTLDAITLSRKMMKGHKMEMCMLWFSFIGWYILSALTFGLSGIFWSNGYRAATYAEFYTEVRNLAKANNIPGADMLNDTYLYEKASQELLEENYADARAIYDMDYVETNYMKGIKKVIADWFGVVLFIDEEVAAVEEIREKKTRLMQQKDALDGKTYPMRLFPIPHDQRRHWIAGLNSSKYYTIWNIFAMFIIFCFIGWCWEVSLHLIQDGIFVNRGMLHGPWIPIYGFGGVLILIALKKLRKNPILQFLAAMVLAGCVEYTTSLVTEIDKGKRWWDYSGYFLNLNGRICGEGLLVFGIMGVAVVYLAAPALDHYLRMVPTKIIVPLTLVLVTAFCADSVYSHFSPNEGKGITDYTPVSEDEEAFAGLRFLADIESQL